MARFGINFYFKIIKGHGLQCQSELVEDLSNHRLVDIISCHLVQTLNIKRNKCLV